MALNPKTNNVYNQGKTSGPTGHANDSSLYAVDPAESDEFTAAREADFQKWLQSPEGQSAWNSFEGDANRKTFLAKERYAWSENGEKAFRRNWLDTAEERKGKREQDRIDSVIREFYDHMNAPIDMNDPEVKALVSGASNAAERQAKMAGVQGGMSVANSERTVANSLAGLGMQRKQLALSALGLRNQRDLSLAQLNEGARLADRGYRAQLQEKQRQEALASGQMWGGLIGAGVGALGYLATPAVGAATMAGGAALGGAVGGQLAGNGFNDTPDRFSGGGSSGPSYGKGY